MKILIVDDQELEREHLAAILSRGNNWVIAVESGEEGLAYLEKNPDIDLTITDYRMPGMNGMDLVAGIKSLNLKMRVWLVSSYLQPHVEAHAKSLGAEKAVWKSGLEHELFLSGIIK